MVMSGHLNSEGIVVQQRPTPAGNKVTNVLFDTQGMDDTDPVGMISIFYFSKDGKTFDVECFSPIKNQYYRDANQFTVSIPKSFQRGKTTSVASTTESVAETISITATSTVSAQSNNSCKGFITPAVIPAMISVGTLYVAAKKKRK